MESISFRTKYNIGDSVYHLTPESDRGIVIDISYSVLNKTVKYEVVFGRNSEDDIWCYEHELNDSKTF